MVFASKVNLYQQPGKGSAIWEAQTIFVPTFSLLSYAPRLCEKFEAILVYMMGRRKQLGEEGELALHTQVH